jgi:hypothetical protein
MRGGRDGRDLCDTWSEERQGSRGQGRRSGYWMPSLVSEWSGVSSKKLFFVVFWSGYCTSNYISREQIVARRRNRIEDISMNLTKYGQKKKKKVKSETPESSSDSESRFATPIELNERDQS